MIVAMMNDNASFFLYFLNYRDISGGRENIYFYSKQIVTICNDHLHLIIPPPPSAG